ncbi:MAG: DNA-binding response regulator [Bacillota bacterium]
MEVLILYSGSDLKEIARGIAEGAEKNEHRSKIIDAVQRDRPISFHRYDLVAVGAPTQGIFRGSVPSELKETLKQCKRTVGQESVAFVTPRFFATSDALKKLMGEMEKLGCVVKNFRSLKTHGDAIEFGKGF